MLRPGQIWSLFAVMNHNELKVVCIDYSSNKEMVRNLGPSMIVICLTYFCIRNGSLSNVTLGLFETLMLALEVKQNFLSFSQMRTSERKIMRQDNLWCHDEWSLGGSLVVLLRNLKLSTTAPFDAVALKHQRRGM